MKKITFIAIITLIFSTVFYAQTKKLSIGLVGTNFTNVNNDNSLSQIDNPLGFGAVAGYNLNESLTALLSTEYFEGDMEDNLGDETDFRTHLSLYVTPLQIDFMRPYFSAGIVHTHRNVNYNSKSNEIHNKLNGRIGAGIDFALSNNAGLNIDFGFYNNGYDFIGIGSSVGFRFNVL